MTTTSTSTTTTTTTMRPIIERQVVNLSDEDYFCNRGWTLSFNFNTKSWVSFHSYLPNWYIGENNFFYSGLNDCCSDFDVLAAVPGPIPTTTTTSSTSTTSTTSTSTSTTTSTSTSTTTTSSTTTTTTTNCPKAGGLREEAFFTGYEVTTPPSYSIDSTATSFAACSAVSYLNSLPVPYTNVVPTYNIVYYQGLFLGSYVYTSNDPQNCTCAPNGWYFTGESQATNRVFRVENCSIVEIVDCIPPTTTTTSSTSSSTTTTTTTQCVCVQDASIIVTTPGTINYLDCYDNLQVYNASNGPEVIVGCLKRGSLIPGTAVYTIEAYGACCTPTPTTTSTTSSTSSTTSTSTSTTSTSTSTSTSTTSTSTSSTTTTTTTVCPCAPIQVTIYADDIANATGNDNPGQNGVVFFQYYDCSNTLQLVQFTSSGVYNFCGCTFFQPYHFKNNAQQTGSSIALPGGEGCSF